MPGFCSASGLCSVSILIYITVVYKGQGVIFDYTLASNSMASDLLGNKLERLKF